MSRVEMKTAHGLSKLPGSCSEIRDHCKDEGWKGKRMKRKKVEVKNQGVRKKKRHPVSTLLASPFSLLPSHFF